MLLVLFSLASALAQCLTMESMAVTGAMGSEGSTTPGGMPCTDCTVEGDSNLLEVADIALPGTSVQPFVLALFVVGALLALGFPKSIPIPPGPLLPKRPRTLEFAVLRI